MGASQLSTYHLNKLDIKTRSYIQQVAQITPVRLQSTYLSATRTARHRGRVKAGQDKNEQIYIYIYIYSYSYSTKAKAKVDRYMHDIYIYI